MRLGTWLWIVACVLIALAAARVWGDYVRFTTQLQCPHPAMEGLK
jgi:hypothetical protein